MENEKKQYITGKIVSSLVKVFPDEEPICEGLVRSVLKDERLNFQIALHNSHDHTLRRMRIEVKGKLAKHVTLRQVQLVPSGFTVPWTDDYYLRKTPGMYPDVLQPIHEKLGIVVPCLQWRSVWVSVHNPKGLPKGRHRLEFELYGEENELIQTFEYKFEVVGAYLAKNDLKVTNWMHYDCISNAHGVKPFGRKFYSILEKYLKAYVDCGCTMLLTPLFTPPLDTDIGEERKTTQLVKVFKTNGEYSFDLSELEKFIRFVMKRGIEYIEFSHLFTQWGGKACPKIVAEVDGEEKRIFGWDVASDDPEYAKFLGAFLPKLMALTKEMGIYEKCYLHLTDEPHADHLETYGKCSKLVKAYTGTMPVMDALSEYSFYEMGIVDFPVPSTPAFDRQYAKHGVKDLLVYYCCSPTDCGYTNRNVNMPSQRVRVLGLQLYASGVKGFLHWGFNFYNSVRSVYTIDPYAVTDAGGFFPSGDAFIVYPCENGVLYSLRAESVKEGYQDYCALKLLEEKIGKEKTRSIVDEFGVKGFNEYPQSAEKHIAFREKINALIKENL